MITVIAVSFIVGVTFFSTVYVLVSLLREAEHRADRYAAAALRAQAGRPSAAADTVDPTPPLPKPEPAPRFKQVGL